MGREERRQRRLEKRKQQHETQKPASAPSPKKNYIYLVIIIALAAVAFYAASNVVGAQASKYDGFAKCLTQKGATFYGAFWCQNCKNQKAMFGSSVQYLNYVECDAAGQNQQSELCIEQGVQNYPTWKINNQTLTGTQQFSALASASGCAIGG